MEQDLSVPENIQKHLQFVAASFGLGQDVESIRRLAESWEEKLEAFENRMIELGMDEIDSFEANDERAALALTYSGSLLSIGPLVDGSRRIDYTSIGLRKDVPESIAEEACTLKYDMEVENQIEFEGGSIKKTSPIYKIVAAPESLNADEQEELIDEAKTSIIDTFVDLNQEL
ncbi:MAG TPA: hypothetical protein ENN41_00245 [Sediminispirochaeta sp.]|nr:hypothetical protein [Sediminispirochaeta sp.]